MFTLKKLVNRNGSDVIAYYSSTEYYADKANSMWVGEGSKLLGLSGVPEPDVMRLLSEGFSPQGRDYPLVENAGHVRHKKGNDGPCSAPKHVSIALALESPERRALILECQRDSIEAVISFIEREELVRCNRGAQALDSIRSKGVVASAHTHMSSRALEPQLHTHILFYNVGMGEDGQTSCVEMTDVYRYTKAIGAVYRSELAKLLHERLEYGIEMTTGLDGYGEENGKDNFKIAGISDEICEHFSTRAKEVRQWQKDNPTAFHHKAALATRRHKDEPSFDEMHAEWTTQIAELKKTHPEWIPDMESLRGGSIVNRKRPINELENLLHETESAITRPRLIERLALDSVGRGIDHAVSLVQRFAGEADIREVSPERQSGPRAEWSSKPKLIHLEPRYAASWMVALEQRVTDRGVASVDNKTHQVDGKTVAEQIRRFEAMKSKEFRTDFKLKDEQKRMVEHCCSETGSMAFVIGWAGTGKTTASQALKQVYDNHKINGVQCEVLGCSTTWKASKKLQKESGAKSIAIAALAKRIEKGDPEWMPKPNSILLVDEASLLGTKSFDVISAAYERAGGKLVVFGDPHQLQSVEAGSPFRALTDKIGYCKLNEITRQEDIGLLELANMSYIGSEHKRGERGFREASTLGKAIMNKLESLGAVHRFETENELLKGLVHNYFESPFKTEDKLVLAVTNSEVRELNKQIREGLKARGSLGSAEYECPIVLQGGKDVIKLAVHDRIRFRKRLDDRADTNEDGVIQHIQKNRFGGLDIRVKMDDESISGKPRVLTFDTFEFDHFNHAYAMTVYGSQGQTCEETFLFGKPGGNAHVATVAMTRAKHKLGVYMLEEDEDDIARGFGKHALKTNVLEEGLVGHQQMNAPAKSNTQAEQIRVKERLAEIQSLLSQRRTMTPDPELEKARQRSR